MTNKPELTDKRSRLRDAAKNYQTALARYQSNIDSPAALQTWDAATSEFMRAIGNRETDIIADLLDEIDELQERRKADSTEPVSFDELNAEVAEVTGGNQHAWDANIYKGHQAVPFMNYNSLARIVDKYRAPQPAPIVPVTLPCAVELKQGLIIGKGCKTETLLTALQRRADYYAEIDAMTPEERAEHDANIAAFKAMLPPSALDSKQVGELTMWVKRLAHSLRNARPDSKLHSDAMDYLCSNGLISVGNVLR